ncbi:MAG: EF-P beta-lysylation protein EpmB [Planctomycetes bacterium]|nr:EF-P beta-lysylation protein EpmB [Planctomycetota bacterium]
MVIVSGSRKPVGPGSPSRPPSWREAMRRAVRDAETLCRMLDLPIPPSASIAAAVGSFPVFAPLEFIARMRPGDPRDPLLLQVLPMSAEQAVVAGDSNDPLAEHAASPVPGLLEKYARRTLIVATGACAVHCRYCFRRHFPYVRSRSEEALDAWLVRLHADPSVDEVVLSGGDPLTLGDERLGNLLDRLDKIPHLRRARLHTRLPIVIPRRVTRRLVARLRSTRLAPIVVVHANHAREIDEPVAASLARLVDAGIPVLNQSVLLRGVNDSAAALEDLCRTLVNARVIPYYLHQLDRVAGARHFETADGVGERLIEELRARLPGYAVPRFVREIPGEPAKRVLA